MQGRWHVHAREVGVLIRGGLRGLHPAWAGSVTRAPSLSHPPRRCWRCRYRIERPIDMLSILTTFLATACEALRPRADLLLENAALRQQLDVLCRQAKGARLRRADRVFWIWLSRRWPRWKSALVIVKPETVLRWHREGYRRYWRWKSKGKRGRPRIPRRYIEFIRRISSQNPSWGEDRIALEMKLKLGIEHSTSTIRRYMVDGGPPTRSTWKRFLATQPLWCFSLRYVLVVLAIDSRRIVHVAVTQSPTLAWVKQQLREAAGCGGGRFDSFRTTTTASTASTAAGPSNLEP